MRAPLGSGLNAGITLILLLGAACATAPAAAPPSATTPAAPVAAAPPAVAPPVARIDGLALTAADLDAHARVTKLARPQALGDLIDLTLLRAALAAQGAPPVGSAPTPEARAAAELAVGRKLALDLPPAADVLVVDHAWIKDAKKASATAKQRKALEELRARVAAGQTLPKAFETLPGIDAAAWHIGDHEEYPYDVVPPEAHDLPPAGLSPIVPGNGGLHLFQVHARKQTPPPADAVHELVRDRLLEGHRIEIVDPSLR